MAVITVYFGLKNLHVSPARDPFLLLAWLAYNNNNNEPTCFHYTDSDSVISISTRLLIHYGTKAPPSYLELLLSCVIRRHSVPARVLNSSNYLNLHAPRLRFTTIDSYSLTVIDHRLSAPRVVQSLQLHLFLLTSPTGYKL